MMLLVDKQTKQLAAGGNGNAGPGKTGVHSPPCSHCGLPVPDGLLEPDSEWQFCCQGCRTAHELIHSCGLQDYYRLLNRGLGREQKSVNLSEADFSEFGTDNFLASFATCVSATNYRVEMLLEGLHCAACVWLVEKLPRILPGVREVRVNWSRSTVTLRWNPEVVDLPRVARTLSQLGYRPHPMRDNEKSRVRQLENRRHLVRIGVSAAAAGNNMLIAAALYLGMFSYMARDVETMLRIASCLVGVVALCWPGRVFLRGAWTAIRTRTPHMDLPIGLALAVGTLVGVVNTVRGSGEIYFDSLTVLICLLLVGRWLQFRQQGRAADAVELLFQLTPQFARRLEADESRRIPIDRVQVGDRLEVLAGELFAVDAQLESGGTHVDEALLTGESSPVPKRATDRVLAGTRNLDQRVVVRATAIGKDTRIGAVLQLVENAAQEKPAIVEWANRIGGYFVVAVMVAAVAVLGSWWSHDWVLAIDHAVALLIVACPCALALATPLAIAVALGRAAQNRILVKSGDALQCLNRPGTIWLDKTGTLTEGRLQVNHWYGQRSCADIVRAIQRHSTHPVAVAFQADSPGSEIEVEFSAVTQQAGGISAVQGQDVYCIGNRAYIESRASRIDGSWEEYESQILATHSAPCWITRNSTIVAVVAIGDRLRSDAKSSIAWLQARGWRAGILSGDHQAVVDHVASQLGIEAVHAHGQMSPEDKLAVVRQSMSSCETVVMVGDGVNDSAALAACSVGVAVKSGAEASLSAAPVYLARPGLDPLLDLFRISRSTARTMRRNFAFSLFYNLGGASLAAAGLINPLIAAILMPVSSLSVIALSMSAGRNAMEQGGS